MDGVHGRIRVWRVWTYVCSHLHAAAAVNGHCPRFSSSPAFPIFHHFAFFLLLRRQPGLYSTCPCLAASIRKPPCQGSLQTVASIGTPDHLSREHQIRASHLTQDRYPSEGTPGRFLSVTVDKQQTLRLCFTPALFSSIDAASPSRDRLLQFRQTPPRRGR